MKKTAVIVSSMSVLSPNVLSFLKVHDIDVFDVGFGCSCLISFEDVLASYDSVWNVGSVLSRLPSYSVFEVGTCVIGKATFDLSHSSFSVRTVKDCSCRQPAGFESLDSELGWLLRFYINSNKEIKSFKFVISDYTESLTEAAHVVEESLIRLLKKHITNA